MWMALLQSDVSFKLLWDMMRSQVLISHKGVGATTSWKVRIQLLVPIRHGDTTRGKAGVSHVEIRQESQLICFSWSRGRAQKIARALPAKCERPPRSYESLALQSVATTQCTKWKKGLRCGDQLPWKLPDGSFHRLASKRLFTGFRKIYVFWCSVPVTAWYFLKDDVLRCFGPKPKGWKWDMNDRRQSWCARKQQPRAYPNCHGILMHRNPNTLWDFGTSSSSNLAARTKCWTFSNESRDFVNGWKLEKRYIPTVGMSNAPQARMSDPDFYNCAGRHNSFRFSLRRYACTFW